MKCICSCIEKLSINRIKLSLFMMKMSMCTPENVFFFNGSRRNLDIISLSYIFFVIDVRQELTGIFIKFLIFGKNRLVSFELLLG